MNKSVFSIVLLFALNNTSYAQHSHKDEYLGQKPPGLTPELFAPGIVATKEHRETEVLFTPNMTELSFTRLGGKYKSPTWLVMQFKDNSWKLKNIPSSEQKHYKQHFEKSVEHMNKIDVFNDIPIVGYTKSLNETYYFYELDLKDGSGQLSYSRKINGKYEKPIVMNKNINKGKYIAHPFVAPDESYLMWDAEVDGQNTPDMFISFKNEDGTWGEAINMGDTINTPAYEQRPKLTPDGKYLFFWRGDRKVDKNGDTYWVGNPHWVDAKIISKLKAKFDM